MRPRRTTSAGRDAQAGLRTGFEIVSHVVAAADAAGIWCEIRVMVRANEGHNVILDQRRRADERRHAEAVAALDEPLRRLPPQPAQWPPRAAPSEQFAK